MKSYLKEKENYYFKNIQEIVKEAKGRFAFIIKNQYKYIIASDNKMTIDFLKFGIIQLNMNNYSI